jgi:hypothetical protein
MSESVFISYPHESADLVDLLHRAIRDRFKDKPIDPVWIDRDTIKPGENIGDKIREGFQKSFCCVLVLNTFSYDSTWCMAEVGAFWGSGKPIIIYRVQPRCNLPDYLQAFRYADKYEEVFDGIEAALEKHESGRAVLKDPTLQLFERCGLSHAFRIPVMNPARGTRIAELVREECTHENPQFRLLASSGYNYLHANGVVWQAGLGEAIQTA